MTRGGKREGAGRKSAFGDEVPTRSATFRLPVWLLDELVKHAKVNDLPQNVIVTLALRTLFEQGPPQPPD